MMPVDPRPKAGRITTAPNATYGIIAEHQEGVRPLPALVIDGYVLTRWTLTEEERRDIAGGEDIWVRISTQGEPLQPLALATYAEALFE